MHPVLFHFGPILIPSYGAVVAVGVVLALFLAQNTARRAGVDPARIWNLSIVALFTALAGSRLLLILVNFTALRRHPGWLLGLAMVHHPLLAAVGSAAGSLAALAYARRHRMDLCNTADALMAPLALGLAFEQAGALLAGSGYGIAAGQGWAAHWAVTNYDLRAALWSAAPLAEPLHPVQAYAALSYLTVAALLLAALPWRRQRGDIAGLGLIGLSATVFFTEFWRDPEGRGALLGGAIDGPQAAALLLLLAGAVTLMECESRSLRTEEVDG